MEKLNFPNYNVIIKNKENKSYIFDRVRKKWLMCTKEEWVRVHCVNFLIECKAPSISITQETFDQIARYNLSLKSRFLMVTNGFDHYFCQMDYKNKQYSFLKDLPNHMSVS